MTTRPTPWPQPGLSGWRVWLLAARPATLWCAAMPVIVGTALAAADRAMRLPLAWAALVSALLIQIGTNLVNDRADFRRGADNDARVGPTRVTQQGWLTSRQVAAGAALCFGLAALCGICLLVVAGWPIAIIGLASIASGIAYTSGPYPLGYLGLGELFVFVFFGMVAVGGTYYVQALHTVPAAWWASVPIGSLAAAVLVVNNLRDRHSDAPAGKRTLAVRLGGAFARREYAGLVVLAYATPVLAWLVGVGHVGWLLPMVSLPYAVRCMVEVKRDDGAALNPLLGRTARLETLFGLLLAVGVLL